MGLRIRILHLLEPIPALGSTGTLTADSKVGGGAAIAQSLRRTPGGYFVGWKNRLYFVPDSRIACAEVVDEDEVPADPPAIPPQTASCTTGVAQNVASSVTAAPENVVTLAPNLTITASEPEGPPPEPGSIVMDKHGRFSRVPFPDAPGAAPAVAAEPTPEEPAHTMKRSGRGRRSMTDQHAPQAPTSLEAAVAEDGAQE